jgi:hypothetical protein
MATEILKTQIGDQIRPMTEEEIVAFELANNEVEIRAEKLATKEALKIATLEKLGLSADEVAALLS